MKALVLKPIKIGNKDMKIGSEIEGSPSFIALMTKLKSVRPLELFPVETTKKVTEEDVEEIIKKVPDHTSEGKYTEYTLRKLRTTLRQRKIKFAKDADRKTLISLLTK